MDNEKDKQEEQSSDNKENSQAEKKEEKKTDEKQEEKPKERRARISFGKAIDIIAGKEDKDEGGC